MSAHGMSSGAHRVFNLVLPGTCHDVGFSSGLHDGWTASCKQIAPVELLHACCRHHNKLADALSNEALDGVGWDGGLKLPNVSSQVILLHLLGTFNLAALHVTCQTVLRPCATLQLGMQA